MTVEKPKPKQLLRPITTGTNSAMNQSQFLAITCNSLQAREKSHVHGAIGFGFASHWLKNWRESFKPITERSNRNHILTFDSHLKTALVNNEPMKAAKQNNSNKFISMSGYLIHQKSIKPIQLLVSGETEYSERKDNNIGNSYSTPSFSF